MIGRTTLLLAAAALVLAGCSRSGEAEGSWVGSYEAGQLSAAEFDIIAHAEFAAATRNAIRLELKGDGSFALTTIGSVSGSWSISGDTVTLKGKGGDGSDLPPVALALDRDGKTLTGSKDADGAQLRFKRVEPAS